MQESGSPAPQASPRRRTGDSTVRWLTVAIIAVIIFWLVGVLSAMMFGVVRTPDAPRTQTERDLMILGAQVDTGKANSQTYAQYIDALVRAGQLSKAQAALDRSLPVTKKDKSYLLAEQAQLYYTAEDYEATVKAADSAMAEAQKELKAFMAANVKAQRKATAGAVMPTSFNTAALVKAEALVALKRYPAAVKAFDVYLAGSPTDADILTQRGLIKIKVADKKGAEADFRAALKFIPDYQPALDGMKQIGATQ